MRGNANLQVFFITFYFSIFTIQIELNTMNIVPEINKLVLVKPSGIHGKGLFAAADIPAGINVLVISGEVIDEDECIRREEEEGNVYIFWNGDNYIDTVATDKIKYINHNCDYNCEVTDRDDSTLFLTAAADIKAGDELTIDYGYEEIYTYCTCETCLAADKKAS
jgi:SET domain-containing protein